MNEHHPITGRPSPYHPNPLFVEAHLRGMDLPSRMRLAWADYLSRVALHLMTREAS